MGGLRIFRRSTCCGRRGLKGRCIGFGPSCWRRGGGSWGWCRCFGRAGRGRGACGRWRRRGWGGCWLGGGWSERDLAPREGLAIEWGVDAVRLWGHVIPPGRTLDSPPITGVFPRGSAAYLRVYRGQHENAELMAISSPSLDRLEVLL